jgi:DNA-binding MarR family transcriptional regulator
MAITESKVNTNMRTGNLGSLQEAYPELNHVSDSARLLFSVLWGAGTCTAISQRILAARLGMTKSELIDATAELREAGLVERESVSRDSMSKVKIANSICR